MKINLRSFDTYCQRSEGHAHASKTIHGQSKEDEDGQIWGQMQRESCAILKILILIYGANAAEVRTLTAGITGTVGDEEAGEGKASTGKTKH